MGRNRNKRSLDLCSRAFAQSRTKTLRRERASQKVRACLTSLLLGNRVGINSHVKSALVGRDLRRHQSSGNGDENGGGSHLESRVLGYQVKRYRKEEEGHRDRRRGKRPRTEAEAGKREAGDGRRRRRAIMLMLNADAGDGVVRRRRKLQPRSVKVFFVLGSLGQRREGREKKGRARGLPAVRTVNLNKREKRRGEQGRGRRTDHGKAATVFLAAHLGYSDWYRYIAGHAIQLLSSFSSAFLPFLPFVFLLSLLCLSILAQSTAASTQVPQVPRVTSGTPSPKLSDRPGPAQPRHLPGHGQSQAATAATNAELSVLTNDCCQGCLGL